jgi:hypothetical protein
MKASDPGYPFPVVYSTELGDYRRATIQEVDQQLHAQARVGSEYRQWKADSAPDEMDRAWANYREMVRLIERAPFPPKHTARGWDMRQGRTRKGVPSEPLLTFVGRDPEKHTRSDRIHW